MFFQMYPKIQKYSGKYSRLSWYTLIIFNKKYEFTSKIICYKNSQEWFSNEKVKAYISGIKRLWFHIMLLKAPKMLLLFFLAPTVFFNTSYWRNISGTARQFGKKELINKEKGVLRTVRKRKSGFGLVIESLLIH